MMDTSTLAGSASRVAVRPQGARLMRKLVPYLYVLPAALFVVAFLIYPMLVTTWRGFTHFDGITDPVFVGLENYAELFADPHFLVGTESYADSPILHETDADRRMSEEQLRMASRPESNAQQARQSY